jgi:ABC-type multidrug transport system ATPase subunit
LSGLVVDRVGFSYRSRPAVLDAVTWQPGRVAALLGPNGAGKSTLFSIMSGARRPGRGQVLVNGVPIRPGAVGWMPQSIQAMPGLRVQEQAALAGWMQGRSRADAWRAARDAIDAVGLGSQAKQRAAQLSGGQLRRLGIAEVLTARPAAVLLDEPTVGLDPVQRVEVLQLIHQLGDRCQVVVATHLVEDLAPWFDSVAVLVGGRLRFTGPVGDFLGLGRHETEPARRADEAYRAVVETGA